MWLSDTSVRRPVLALVVNLLLIVFGILAFTHLPLREYPDIDPPIVSINTTYPGAAANVVETRVTEVIEGRIAGLEGIRSITSKSRDGRSDISVRFNISRDIDAAANDIRDRVSRIMADLPDGAEAPDISKSDADEKVIMWIHLTGKGMTSMEVTDYAKRYVEDRFAALDGVARVRLGGAKEQAMRIWLDRNRLAAFGLTVSDIEQALRQENVELPAGTLESHMRDFTVRMLRSYQSIDDFRGLVLKSGKDGYLVRLADVARIEIGPTEERSTLRGNGIAMVGIGLVKQSRANTLQVARLAKQEMVRINEVLPTHMHLEQSYDSSIFIDNAIDEVFKTLLIAILLVVLVIYLFLGNVRAMLIPAVTVPISLIGTFSVLYTLGYSINLLTLLALVLAIGLVVDDAIVVVENIHRRIEMGESRLVAAFRGTRQVGFAVIATTTVLIAVFVPITFLEGDIGRLFSEFAIAIAAAVTFSAFAALTIAPMIASKWLAGGREAGRLAMRTDHLFDLLHQGYLTQLARMLRHPWLAILIIAAMLAAAILLARVIPQEYSPKEDRGVFHITIKGPEGVSYRYMREHMDEVERRLLPFTKTGEFQRLLIRAPGTFGATSNYSDARATVVLSHWKTGRKPIWYYINEVKKLTADIPGVRVSTNVRQPFGGGEVKPVQFVLGGPTYEELAKWRDIIMARAAENPGLIALDHDYDETRPQIGLTILRDRADALGVSVTEINHTLETLLGSRRVTTFIDRGKEYDVLLESEKTLKQEPSDIANTWVRSARSGQLIPLASLVEMREFAASSTLNRYNRQRAITLEANLAEGYSLGEALSYLQRLVRENLPPGATIDYKGPSQDFIDSGSSMYLVFILALTVVFLVLAGQFESFIQPLIIMLTVPLAITGALAALWAADMSLNIYSQIGLIILVGIAAKNGILIVEFINQLRDEGVAFHDAIPEAAGKRLRPIVMTALTTAMGAVPLILSTGAGAETRLVIGTVILAGVTVTTFFTLFIVPAMYQLWSARTASPKATGRRLERELAAFEEQV
ncbi:efflux RND transporter permease subunit [Mariprofundus erugo]|uniref:Efflux RND transporter permease subunit n=1 Tax=Mariprofundus erugo TaxID=2528639 RepID=A0A5R9GSV2_9PROT|nr:efflux RND transporter permease subunit [Mariprofundus erugo]TLS68678.1 efflux RND transporter permease subunit [Mariprofundus erugo]